ncbi:MAG: STAS domain-containing protein [Sporichthyaceae bacterium]
MSLPQTESQPFAVGRGPAGEVVAVGEIDLAAVPLLREVLADTPGAVVVDLTAATYLDSTGVSALYEHAHRSMQILVRENSPVSMVVAICGLWNVATVHAL